MQQRQGFFSRLWYGDRELIERLDALETLLRNMDMKLDNKPSIEFFDSLLLVAVETMNTKPVLERIEKLLQIQDAASETVVQPERYARLWRKYGSGRTSQK